jgi:hypothetical protein
MSRETLRGWAAVRAANEQVTAAHRALAIEASVAVTDAVRSCDGWEPTGYGSTVGAVWRDIIGIVCHSTCWYAEVYYDGEADCLGPFSTAIDAARAVAASGLDIGDFLTAHPWLAPEVPS